MDQYRAAKNKFEVNTTFTGTGNIGATSSLPYDVRGHNTLRVAVENVGGGNVVKVYGRIRHQSAWTLLDTITGGSSGVSISCSVADEVYFNCDTYSASGGTPALIASGFFLTGGGNSAGISGTPSANQVAFWDSASSITGSSSLTWSSSTLAIAGYLTVSSPVADSYVATLKCSTTTGVTRMKWANSDGSKFFELSADFITPGDEHWSIHSDGGGNQVVFHSNGQFMLNGLGSVSAPKLCFWTDRNTGLYSPSADNLSLVGNGIAIVNVDGTTGSSSLGATGSTATHYVQGSLWQAITSVSTADFPYVRSVATGSASFSGGTSASNGMAIKLYGGSHASKASQMEWLSGGSSVMTVTSAGYMRASSGAATAGSVPYSFGAATGSGMYNPGSNGVALAANGAVAIQFNSSQKMTVGASGNAQYHAIFGRGLDINYSTSGVTAYISLQHSSNTGGSGAAVYLSVGGGSAFDPHIAFNVLSAQDWCFGVDNSDSDTLKASSASALGSSDCFRLTTTGLLTITAQLGVGGTAVNSKGINLTLTASQMGGTNQYGINQTVTCSSAATGGFSGYQVSLTTQNTSFTCAYVLGCEIGAHTAGAGSTITRAASYFGSVQTAGGTGNAWGCDNVAFSGNFVLNFSSTNLSYFAGKLATNAGLGVGNSAAASTLGTVVKKTQIFDASGSSLGYVAIYDAIT